MRELLEDHVNCLFAGHPEAEDIRQEILQNTLDRYDDLVAEGKDPQAAYTMAIAGIGDIGELLNGGEKHDRPAEAPRPAALSRKQKILRALGVGLCILCPVPVIILEHTRYENMVGVPLMFLLIAAATVLMILSARDGRKAETSEDRRRSMGGILWPIATLIYFVISFLTRAWFITWLIFPIAGAVSGLIHAILDLKEAINHENKCNY